MSESCRTPSPGRSLRRARPGTALALPSLRQQTNEAPIGRRHDMSTVLLAERVTRTAGEEESAAQNPVPITLLLVNDTITFQPVEKTNKYSVTGKTITLFG